MTHLSFIDLSHSSGFTTQGLQHLYALPSLNCLVLCGTAQGGAVSFEGIATASSLDTLALDNTSVHDAHLQPLTALTSLTMLSLGFCAHLTPAFMLHVGRLTRLKDLSLGGCGMVDNALPLLGCLPRLSMLIVPRGVTDAGLLHLAALPSLQKLFLCGCPAVTSAGMQHIGRLTNLQVLSLNARVTDQGLQHLTALTNLAYSAATSVQFLMAADGMRVLVLAALAVRLLAATVSGARVVIRALVPGEGGRILAAETFAHHTALPEYLEHIPRRQALATSCGRTTVTIRSQYLGPYDLHNDIYNMTFYNGCAYNVTSPLRVWQYFNFGNVWEGILDNPDPNPSQYQTGYIFVQTTPGYCEMHMNRGANGDVQMFPGETVNIVYAWTGDFRPCAQELRFSNGNSYSLTNTTECQTAAVI
ncbi:unnamed protein product [Closterium sp. Naga37s-1]|nr:unnamed protein product [Closterium sp. Naga37s-1]